MLSSKLSALRPGLRAAYGFQWTRPLGRRGYTAQSLQERIGMGSDRPWQMAAVGVTIPGLFWLRRGETSKPHSSGHSSIREESKAMAESVPKAQREAGVQQNVPSTQSESATSSSEAEGTNTQFSSASQSTEGTSTEFSSAGESTEGTSTQSSSAGQSAEMDASIESQAKKMADKQPSQRVDPTQK
ncbi:hypothetical protein VTI74DRAFT_4205 [Chaetomium olivicolor]